MACNRFNEVNDWSIFWLDSDLATAEMKGFGLMAQFSKCEVHLAETQKGYYS